MANIADGTYVILSVANTDLAIDSYGATDGNNSNVDLFTRNDSDAQFIRVWTRADGSRQLMFSATGKCVDVANGTVSQGQNIQQYDNNGTNAQKWTITDTGETATYNSTTYNVFKIFLASNTSYLIDTMGVGTPASGANLCIAGDEGTSADQKWIFIPANPVPTGTYRIRSCVDPSIVCDVAGISMANGARVFLCGENGGNNQTFWVSEYDSTGRAKIVATHSMKLIEITNTNAAVAGDAVCQCEDYDQTDQRWIIVPDGTATVNGVTVPAYRIHNYAAEGLPLLMDAADGGATPGTYLRVYHSTGSDAQRWIFDPTEMIVDTLPVPASIRASATKGSAGSQIIEANIVKSVYPNWICDGLTYQCRYRYRTRPVGKSIGDWTEWHSIADGSVSNNGFGSIGAPNVTVPNGSRKYSPVAASLTEVDNTAVDYEEAQFEIRRFIADYNSNTGLSARGNSASQTIKMVWRPTVTVSDMTWTPEGLVIDYVSDYKRGGNTITINNIYVGSNKLCGKYIVSALPYSGSVTIPVSELLFIPVESASATMSLSFSTDSDTTTASYTKTIAYEASHGLTIKPTYTINDNYSITATITAHAYDACYVLYSGKLRECEQTSAGTFRIIPPLNERYTVFFVCRTSSAWGSYSEERNAIPCRWYVWNFGDKCAVLAIGNGSAPSMTDDLQADSTKETTTGREYPVFRFGASKSRDLSISGAYVEGFTAHGERSDFEALMNAKHAVFRNPWSEIYDVAVKEISKTRIGNSIVYGDITVKQEAESV